MKKLFIYLIIIIPIKIFSENPPPPGLPDEPPAIPINEMQYILLIAGIAFGAYVFIKRKPSATFNKDKIK